MKLIYHLKIIDIENRQIFVIDKYNQNNVTKQIFKDIIQDNLPKIKYSNLQMGDAYAISKVNK